MVRLKAYLVIIILMSIAFQFQNGAVKSSTGLVIISYQSLFQFQNGAVKSEENIIHMAQIW